MTNLRWLLGKDGVMIYDERTGISWSMRRNADVPTAVDVRCLIVERGSPTAYKLDCIPIDIMLQLIDKLEGQP